MARTPSPPGIPSDDPGSPTPAPLPPRFRYEAALGEGGLGTVVRAYDTQLRTPVAIKTIRHALRERNREQYEYLVARFEREAIAGAKPLVRGSPYVVTVYDQVVDNAGNAFLILEFMPGGTLHDRLKDGPLPVAEALRVIADTARGLLALHNADLVHRDVKPENIFIAADGRAVVGDLGIVQMSSTTFRTRVDYGSAQGHPGTPFYMSPEQETTTGFLAAEADQFSLGAVLFELVTGRRYKQVYEDERAELLGRLPPDVSVLIRRMTAERPADRYRGMGAVLAAIEAIDLRPAPQRAAAAITDPGKTRVETRRADMQPVARGPVLSPPQAPAARRPVRRRTVLAVLGAYVVTGGAAGGAWTLTHAGGGTGPGTPTLPYAADFQTWFTASFPGQQSAFVDSAGAYHVLSQLDGRGIYATPPGPLFFADFVLDVDARLIGGPDNGSYGVIFRAQAIRPGDRYTPEYQFLLIGDGSFFLDFLNGDGSRTPLQTQKTASAINARLTTNHLRVECRGTQIVVAVNGTTLGTYTGPVTSAGEIGLEVENPHGSAATEVAFTNLRVTKPG